MRITLLSSLALGAVVFVALAEPVVWAAEPVTTDGDTDGCCHSGRHRRRSWRLGRCRRLWLTYTSTSASTTVFARLQRLLI